MTPQISANIQNATFFAIMADQTADVSKKEGLRCISNVWPRRTCIKDGAY